MLSELIGAGVNLTLDSKPQTLNAEFCILDSHPSCQPHKASDAQMLRPSPSHPHTLCSIEQMAEFCLSQLLRPSVPQPNQNKKAGSLATQDFKFSEAVLHAG